MPIRQRRLVNAVRSHSESYSMHAASSARSQNDEQNVALREGWRGFATGSIPHPRRLFD
jgi:hypothetical protein